MSLSDATNVPGWHINVFLLSLKLLHEYITFYAVLLHSRVTNIMINLRLTFLNENSFIISDCEEVEYIPNR